MGRFWNNEVLVETDAVIETILRELVQRHPEPLHLPDPLRGSGPSLFPPGRCVLLAGLALGVSALASAALAQGRPVVRIEQAAARVVVIPEQRRDVAVSVRPGAAGLPTLRVRREGARVVVDGGLTAGLFDRLRGRPSAADCVASDGRPAVKARGLTWGIGQLPMITVRAPFDVEVEASGAVFGFIGPTSRTTLASDGCGDWALGSAPYLAIRQAGSGRIQAQDSASSLSVQVTGKGSVVIVRGFTAAADLRVKGPGRIDHRGSIGKLTAEVDGKGLVTIVEVSGTVENSVRGGGDVRYGRPGNRSYRMGG